jgi:hypothetical protein
MSRYLVIALFSSSALGFVALALLARRPNSRIPSFGVLSSFVMCYEVGRFPVGRVAVLGFWWWLGWHLFAR